MIKRSLNTKRLVLFIVAIAIFLGFVFTLLTLSKNNKIDIPPLLPEEKIEQKDQIECKSFKSDAPKIIDTIFLNKKWALIGNEFKSEEQQIVINGFVKEQINKYINQENPLKIEFKIEGIDETYTGEYNQELKKFTVDANYEKYKPGVYKSLISLETKCGKIEKNMPDITVTYPVYVTWTLDYEGYDIPDQHLTDIANLADKYGIVLTHFFNPRLYTSGVIPGHRQEAITNYVKRREVEKNETVGLHLHMFPDMVKAAGVDPHTNPQTWGGPVTDGYNIMVMSYNYTDLMKIMKWSKEVFAEKGLPTPTVFRAGGWYANSETLRAVQDSGFISDSSGRTNYALVSGGVVGPWDLMTTTQPYKPNLSNQNSADGQTLSIWEFPNNGADSWAFSGDQMIARFKDNYNGSPTTERRIVTFLSHPEWYYVDKPKMEQVFDYVGKFQYKNDQGPVIFIGLDEAANIWDIKN